MSLWGGLLKFGYRLQRHRIGPLALGYWPLLLGLIGSVIAYRTTAWPYALILSVVGLVLAVIMLVGRRQRYIRFRHDESLAAHLPPDVKPIKQDEKILIKAVGTLEVRDKRKYFVCAEADFATMENREHVVMARIPFSRMWLVAQSLKEQEGWWYAFVSPPHIRSIQTGWLHHGLRPQPALQLVYERRQFVERRNEFKETVTEETIYLSVAKVLTLHRLLENLVRDAGQRVERQ